ncbi:hypothetical protein [Mycoplasma sp. Mirounga ES2805-ORL]|uniref:hypothetical protein n=1 Tax=Mycoplasma sp. Mirounga ES2805-ORL TaxID=754514 RepID=UPI00197B1534|nr:hypothetical protein [Mycoplasma sp. Mirounga ES2805-ORL]QSF13539.1 hypothetical protein JXZ90_02590 [Mycoplasma sp. Mirounga ES2805-ORL]
MEQNLIMCWKELKSILDKNKIKYSLSPSTTRLIINKRELTLGNFSISIFWKDFDYLHSKYEDKFVNDSEKIDYFRPYFNFEGQRIYFELIIGTSIEKLNKMNKPKNLKSITYWGNNKKSLLLKVFHPKKRITSRLLINILNEDRYTRFIVLSDSIDRFYIFRNSNWYNSEKIEVENETFNVLGFFIDKNKQDKNN